MTRDARYDPLFEPMRIGPVTAKNRFYQVPHCNGGGYRDPSAVAAMRRVKSEGGWGVIFTEQCEVHHSSEITPYIELRLWDDRDIPMLARMAEAMKSHGALAGIELVYPGVNGPNMYTREVPMAPTAMPIRTFTNDPVQARAMDKSDIRNLRRWYVNAIRRAKTAGFDLICLYGAHGFGVIQHFLSRVTNQRTDEYGGSLSNRARLARELLGDAREAVGDTMGITLRLSLDELDSHGFTNEELREFVAEHHDLPDLWDFAHGTWEDCSGSSRFVDEASQESLVAGLKALTDKPVVGVGRFTSPDQMVRQISQGILDFIGCARPSIADPFLPKKVESGRIDEIRECIGCNICITGDMTMAISRCTQNPTFMEEWRRGWHPEQIEPKGASESVLVVGSGPAGLEAARALGQRGYAVSLAEARDELGGRVLKESQLPGLAAWQRVADYRIYQLNQMGCVDIFRGSEIDAEQVLAYGAQHVAVATGATWRRDGVGRHHVRPIAIDPLMRVLTPDDLMAGQRPEGPVVIFDDDHYYIGGVLARLLADCGCAVQLITPAAHVSEWTLNTLEQARIHRELVGKGVSVVLNRAVHSVESDRVVSECVYTGDRDRHAASAVVLVTARVSNDDLTCSLLARQADWADAGLQSVRSIGDALAPGPIAWATQAGHRYARELDAESMGDALPFRREIVALGDERH